MTVGRSSVQTEKHGLGERFVGRINDVNQVVKCSKMAESWRGPLPAVMDLYFCFRAIIGKPFISDWTLLLQEVRNNLLLMQIIIVLNTINLLIYLTLNNVTLKLISHFYEDYRLLILIQTFFLWNGGTKFLNKCNCILHLDLVKHLTFSYKIISTLRSQVLL